MKQVIYLCIVVLVLAIPFGIDAVIHAVESLINTTVSMGAQPIDVLPETVKVLAKKDGGTEEGTGVSVGSSVYSISDHHAVRTLIVTCDHVVRLHDDLIDKVIVIRNGKRFDGTVIADDKKLDLALIEVKEHWPTLQMFTGKLRVGEPDIAVGYPLGAGISISSGFIGERAPADKDMGKEPHFQESAPIWPGNSGGGIFVNRGGWKLAGIVEFSNTSALPGVVLFVPLRQIASEISYAIPIITVEKFLTENHY